MILDLFPHILLGYSNCTITSSSHSVNVSRINNVLLLYQLKSHNTAYSKMENNLCAIRLLLPRPNYGVRE